MRRPVEVEIAGQRLVIRSDEGPRYVQELADYVDGQIQQLIPPGRSVLNLQRIALLVAIQLADELFREKDMHRRFRERVAAKLDAIEQALQVHAAHVESLAIPIDDSEPDPTTPSEE